MIWCKSGFNKYFCSTWFQDKIVEVTERWKNPSIYSTWKKKKTFKGGLTEVYKNLSWMDNINACYYFWYSTDDRIGGINGSSKNKFRGDIRKCFVTQRIINVWNGLLGKVVEAKTVGSFKKQLDAILGETLYYKRQASMCWMAFSHS